MVKTADYGLFYKKPGTVRYASTRSRACQFGEHSSCSGRSVGSETSHSCGCHCHRRGVRVVQHRKGRGHKNEYDHISEQRAFKGIW